jgi:hypothetical protein
MNEEIEQIKLVKYLLIGLISENKGAEAVALAEKIAKDVLESMDSVVDTYSEEDQQVVQLSKVIGVMDAYIEVMKTLE